METNYKCPKCGTKLPAYAHFCKKCGVAVDFTPQQNLTPVAIEYSSLEKILLWVGIISQVLFLLLVLFVSFNEWVIALGVLGILVPIIYTNAYKNALNEFNKTSVGYYWILALIIPAIIAYIIGFSYSSKSGFDEFVDSVAIIAGKGFQYFLILALIGIDSYIWKLDQNLKKGLLGSSSILLIATSALTGWCLPFIIFGIVIAVIVAIVIVFGLVSGDSSSSSSSSSANREKPDDKLPPPMPTDKGSQGPCIYYEVLWASKLGDNVYHIDVMTHSNELRDIADEIHNRTNNHTIHIFQYATGAGKHVMGEIGYKSTYGTNNPIATFHY